MDSSTSSSSSPFLFIKKESSNDSLMQPLNPLENGEKMANKDNEDEDTMETMASGKKHKARQLSIIAFLMTANFFIWITASCSGPFFAIEATERKGQSISQVGFCNGISLLFMAIFAPLCGKYMALMRDDRVNSLGLALFSFSTFCFGLCNFVSPGWPFFWAIVLARILGGVGICAIITGGWAILGRLFPERVSMLRGIGETVNGIGFSLGPLLGSSLYQIGGFTLPLLVTGTSIGIVAILSLGLPFLIEREEKQWKGGRTEKCGQKEKEEEEAKIGIFQFIRIPNVFLCICCLLLMSIGWFFYDPSLPAHLSSFSPNHTSSTEIATQIGWLMTSLSGVYALFAPFWGFLFERHFVGCQTSIMLIGSVGISASLVLMGPTPFLGLPKSIPLLFVAFVMNGIFSAILYVPMFRWCQDAVKARGFDEKSTNGLIAGIHHSVFSFGAFFATSLGGLSAEHLGFAWTATGVAILQLTSILLQIVVAVFGKSPRKEGEIDQEKGD